MKKQEYIIIDEYDSTALSGALTKETADELAYKWNKERHGFNHPQYIRAVPQADVRKALWLFDWETV